MKLLYFLLTNQNYIFLGMFAMLTVVALVNFVHNSYAKQNARLKKFNKKTLQKPNSIVLQIKHLPEEYQRQWRAYTSSGCDKPSTVFEFVKLPKRYLLWFAHLASTAVCIVYLVVSIYLQDSAMFAIQVAFLLLGLLVVMVTRLIGQLNLAQARRVFGKFLHDLNAVTTLLKGGKIQSQATSLSFNTTSNTPTQPVTSVAPTSLQCTMPPLQSDGLLPTPTTSAPTQPLPSTETTNSQKLATSPSELSAQTPSVQASADSLPTQKPTSSDKNSGDVIEKAVQILRQKGLDNPRTAEEQRKLNIALNNLLQACCKRK